MYSAQRAVFKVILFKPRNYSTAKLYLKAKVLTVRQLYILIYVLRRHSKLPLDPIALSKRQGFPICHVMRSLTAFARRQQIALF